MVYAHVMICEAFHGVRPDGYVVRHMDGVRRNIRPDNLEYGTVADNMRDKVRHGTSICGESHPNARLLEREVQEIRGLWTANMDHQIIADRYGIAKSTVSLIGNKSRWPHVADRDVQIIVKKHAVNEVKRLRGEAAEIQLWLVSNDNATTMKRELAQRRARMRLERAHRLERDVVLA
jgi:hypothetical protein